MSDNNDLNLKITKMWSLAALRASQFQHLVTSLLTGEIVDSKLSAIGSRTIMAFEGITSMTVMVTTITTKSNECSGCAVVIEEGVVFCFFFTREVYYEVLKELHALSVYSKGQQPSFHVWAENSPPRVGADHILYKHHLTTVPY